MKIRVLFLYGGDSVEHEISIISALQAMDGLDTERYEAIPCYVSKQGDMYGGEHLRKLAHYRDLDALLQRVTRVHIERRRGQPVLVRDEARRFSRAIPFDIVFPILHGVNGEDGSVAGFCRMLHLPFCESDVLCGAIGQDKAMQKRLLQQAGLPNAKIWTLACRRSRTSSPMGMKRSRRPACKTCASSTAPSCIRLMVIGSAP